MKLPWPTAFADGDIEEWLHEFESIAACNGIKGDSNLATALGTLLAGRAKAAFKMLRQTKAAATYAELREGLIGEFNSELDHERAMQDFQTAQCERHENPTVFAERLDRLLRWGLPSLDETSRQRLLRDKFVNSFPKPVQEKMRMAMLLGTNNIRTLIAIAQTADSDANVEVRQIGVAACKANEDRFIKELEDLRQKVNALSMERNQVRRRPQARCFNCNAFGHFARACTQRKYSSYLFTFSNGRVPCVTVKIGDKQVRAIVDTGAGVSITKKVENVPLRPCTLVMKAVGGQQLAVNGVQNLPITVGNASIVHSMVVVEGVEETIIGADLLRRLNAKLDLGRWCMFVNGVRTDFDCSTENVAGVRTVESTKVPQCSCPLLRQCVSDFQHLFTDENDKYGYCDWLPHRIELLPGASCRPINRRVPFKLIPEMQRQVREMLQAGIIQRSTSPYSSPVLLIRKPDGSYRFCIDFRELNSITVKDALPMPDTTEIFAKLHDARVISLIDLRSGYWQLPIAENDRAKTAFSVDGEQYEFLRMPFGLCNAPATFRRLLLRILDQLDGVVVYGDDIVIFSTDETQHAIRLREVLKRIDKAGLRLNAKKCQIGRSDIVCLGHRIGGGKVVPLPEKLETIRNFPVPKSKRQLRAFLGVAGYDAKFVPKFSEKALPLFKLLHKGAVFTWTPEADQAFNELKQTLTEIPRMLQLPKPGEPFTVAVDASDIGIGAVLSQSSGVVEYASRILTDAERKYSTTEKECLAVVWALEKWRTYLIANQFHVITDHKPLLWLTTAKDPRGRLARWAYRLQEFTFTIGHVDGKHNDVPDALSRPSSDIKLPEAAIPVNAVITERKELLLGQKEDEVIQKICQHLRDGTRPTESHAEWPAIARIWQRFRLIGDELRVEVDTHERLRKRTVLFVPVKERKKLIEIAHGRIHMGAERVYDHLRRRAYWPSMKEDVVQFLRCCARCQLNCESKEARPPMQSIDPEEILQLWGMDVFGPLPVSPQGNRYIVVMTEHFSRWVEAVPTADQTGETISRVFVNNVIARYGVPKAVITDQGPCFESKVFNDLLAAWGITRRRTSPYHPQTNGLTERFNRTLKQWLNNHELLWEEALPDVLLGYRTSVHSTTTVSPFELLYGREPRLLLDSLLPQHAVPPYTQEERAIMERRASARTAKRQRDNKVRYDTQHNAIRWKPFKVGDSVKVKEHSRPPGNGPGIGKFKRKWKGPLTVLKTRGTNCQIKDGSTTRWLHSSQLARWHDRRGESKEGASVGDRNAVEPSLSRLRESGTLQEPGNKKNRERPTEPDAPSGSALCHTEAERRQEINEDVKKGRNLRKVNRIPKGLGENRNEGENRVQTNFSCGTRHSCSRSDIRAERYRVGKATKRNERKPKRMALGSRARTAKRGRCGLEIDR